MVRLQGQKVYQTLLTPSPFSYYFFLLWVCGFKSYDPLLTNTKIMVKIMTIVNFDELRKSNPTFRCNGWCKTVTSLDKSTPTGYSLVGEFVRKGKGEMNYADGVYLDCSKPQGQKNYHIFQVEGDNVEVLQVLENPQGRWATELWDTIDKALSDSPKFSDEYQAQQLANLVLENCHNDAILDKVARIISSQFDGDSVIRNKYMARGLFGSEGMTDYPMAYRGLWKKEELDETKASHKALLDYDKYLEEGLTPHQAIFRVYIEADDWKKKTYTLDDIKSGKVAVDFKVISEFEAMEKGTWNSYAWNHWYFDAEYFRDDALKDFIILGYNKGNKRWGQKPTFHIRVFSDELWNGYCGIRE